MSMVSFLAMYGLMYMMVDRFSNVYTNLNQFYMAGAMTGAMLLIELLVMGAMYKNLRGRVVAGAIAISLTGVFFALTRMQTGIGNAQFLRSMIPHHGAAILMCEQAPITDPQIKTLCAGIIKNQQSEVDLMRRLLESN